MSKSRKKSASPLTITGAFSILIILGLVFLYQSSEENQAPTPVEATVVGDLPESISVWFSDPLVSKSSGGPETPLVNAIQNANASVDMAIYNLTLPNLSDALIQAHRRGVKVRLVMESEAMDKDVPQKITAAGIPIVGDQKQGLMHNKFTIIDGQEVWMGSMNYTQNSAYTDFNNLVRFQSKAVVRNYQVNFDEMFEQHKFGSDKVPNTPAPRVTVAGSAVETYFSPDDGVLVHVEAEVAKAQHTIDFMAYSFTSDEIADAMLARAKAGVTVRGVFDMSQVKSNTGGEYNRLKRAGLDVYMDGISGLMHHKVIIIDGETVITGSYNFSNNAEKVNDENLVIIHNAQIAQQFLNNFQEVYDSVE